MNTKNKKVISFKVGDVVEVSPDLTLLENWITGTIIKIFKNPFIGDEIAIKDEQGRIFFGAKDYFKLPKTEEICMR